MKKVDSFLFVESRIIYNFMGSAGQCKVVKKNKKVSELHRPRIINIAYAYQSL